MYKYITLSMNYVIVSEFPFEILVAYIRLIFKLLVVPEQSNVIKNNASLILTKLVNSRRHKHN